MRSCGWWARLGSLWVREDKCRRMEEWGEGGCKIPGDEGAVDVGDRAKRQQVGGVAREVTGRRLAVRREGEGNCS